MNKGRTIEMMVQQGEERYQKSIQKLKVLWLSLIWNAQPSLVASGMTLCTTSSFKKNKNKIIILIKVKKGTEMLILETTLQDYNPPHQRSISQSSSGRLCRPSHSHVTAAPQSCPVHRIPRSLDSACRTHRFYPQPKIKTPVLSFIIRTKNPIIESCQNININSP